MSEVMQTDTIRPKHSGYHFTDDIFKLIISGVLIQISLNFVSKSPVDNMSTLVGDGLAPKSYMALSESMMPYGVY